MQWLHPDRQVKPLFTVGVLARIELATAHIMDAPQMLWVNFHS
jgi:hypothetical protein